MPAMTSPVKDRDGAGTPHEMVANRAEFVRAFVEHAGLRPASERFTVRWPTLLTVSGLSLVAALVVGVFMGLVGDEREAAKGNTASYSAIAGWDCAAKGTAGFEASGRTSRWTSVAAGGWTADGCHGGFGTMPVSGKRDEEDAKQTATWHFTPGAGLRCDVRVFVPGPEAAGSTPELTSTATYTIVSGDGTVDGTFTVDQRANPGTWARGGSITTHDKELVVRLSNRGTPATDRVALTQAKVSCGA
jgi:hypothetical protein